jgi:hypothetical protein
MLEKLIEKYSELDKLQQSIEAREVLEDLVKLKTDHEYLETKLL